MHSALYDCIRFTFLLMLSLLLMSIFQARGKEVASVETARRVLVCSGEALGKTVLD